MVPCGTMVWSSVVSCCTMVWSLVVQCSRSNSSRAALCAMSVRRCRAPPPPVSDCFLNSRLRSELPLEIAMFGTAPPEKALLSCSPHSRDSDQNVRGLRFPIFETAMSWALVIGMAQGSLILATSVVSCTSPSPLVGVARGATATSATSSLILATSHTTTTLSSCNPPLTSLV
jgi:hypothetical protein